MGLGEGCFLYVNRLFPCLIRCQHNVNMGIKSQMLTHQMLNVHVNTLYKVVVCFVKQCNDSNKVGCFYL